MIWIASYIYYAEPWDRLLVEAVKPFAEEMIETGLAKKYFFIRYWEHGPHIRLRFFGDEKVLNSELKPKLENWFGAWMKANPSTHTLPAGYEDIPEKNNWYPNNSIQWIEYEPETERYGGPVALPIGEDQFQSCSTAVLEVMDQSAGWTYDHALGTAIQMHLAFSNAVGMDKLEASAFHGWIFQSWLPMAIPSTTEEAQRPDAVRGVLTAFETQFQEQKDALLPFIEAFWQALDDKEEFDETWVNNWVKEQQEIKAQLEKLDADGKVIYPEERTPAHANLNQPWEKLKYWSLYASYVHMINNRLGVQNRDEGYLGFLLSKGMGA